MKCVRKSWFDLFIQDAAFFSMILCIAAGNLSLLKHIGDPAESVYWKNEAIKIIDSRLDKSPREVSASTIAAVASLVSYEVSTYLP
jgi:hypothetical protein